ncbi:argininosuccinate lyase [Oceanobacillus iheyensis HTE831]|uniref:Argininosuccinate lyase n=1 Tax=Oceanobacillus iheyensis (strain DSM 14371 / CIP 107618 / JCM 11309 / KCTC 3954 / HTE831) TaxID=221109 RepID=ARLY_OCEIH|nr:argininosuccinate lyase [Oceanobacillus iheyensis]Q8ELT9.1 RecName: Full=Argininosuccinate lyase; Short=ASAL; AltName: Full=Arginosuccinase [Oceanobacillus iheyensis HTE831]BAC15084.1 argininosuccinate lyase [Oceanobacillus iheyensis HTE831]
MKLWGGRFTKPTNELVDEYASSIQFDKKLAAYDIEGSLAHVAMLKKCEIIPAEDADKIAEGLKIVLSKIEAGEAELSNEHEDIHMNVEKLLIDEVGPVGGRLHTGRSRNDQVALDMRLYLRDVIAELSDLLKAVQQSLITQAKANMDTVMPGYTHLQRAQPVLFAHHMMAYVFMFQRDVERFQDSLKRVNKSPLGAGALAGTTFPIDRHFVAEQLGFDGICENSLDAVSDRDFVVEFLSNSALVSTHLSRLCEELVQWSSAEFNFVELDDSFTTGSSMMPQKKNPDVAELVRGKTGRVYGHLMGMLTTLKGLPLAYNKDMQEDKEGMFDAHETLKGALQLFAPMMESMKVNKESMYKAVSNDYSNATDLADYLVNKGMTFRESHAVVGEAVLHCIEQNKYLLDLTLKEFKQYSEVIDEDIFDVLKPEAVVNARSVEGGTAKESVLQQIAKAEKLLESAK